MCGITGLLGATSGVSEPELRRVAGAMAESVKHRGPDDGDVWVDGAAGIALGHRRLSVIDLSPAGHQPMVSADGRLVIAYNGEVYNFAELRAELEAAGIRFRGHSDTEVIVEGCARWGVAETVARLIGMFVFALWDRGARRLTLVRDRLGIKPLYWGRFGGLVLFGSELKALRAHPGFVPELDRDAVSAFLRHNYIPAPHTIYRGVHKLEPGCLLTLSSDGAVEQTRYWDARRVAIEGQRDLLDLAAGEAADRLDELLGDAVRRRMVADVPLGAFLSGGIDSSTVAALMATHSERPPRTFTVGFREPGHNEAEHAKAVAAHLGTDHTELYVEPDHARDVIPKLADYYDEPFADSSQIPTFLISELTRRHVTVALSGDGGDELFAGYNRYSWAQTIWKNVRRMPGSLRRATASGITSISPTAWDRAFSIVPGKIRPPQSGDKLHKIASILVVADPDAIYRRLVSHWEEPDDIVIDGHEPHGILWDESVAGDVQSFADRMRFLDTVTYLPDDLLTKVDRASMAVSLEARIPLLDHRVVEFAWRLPAKLVAEAPQPKWLLRQVLERYVPKSLIERPKMGFGVPIDAWLRGPLRDWAEALIGERRLREEGVFRPEPIRRAWDEHLSGRRNWQYLLWDVLMFQAWRERWL